MQDRVDRVVEQVAVMADDEHGVRIAREVVLQPQRAFEVEIVGRLVEQQQVGLGEQHRGERDAHAPAAGELRGRALLRARVEAEAGEDGGGARRRGMRVDVGEPRLDFGDAVRVGRGLCLGQQRARARGRPRARSRSARSGPARRLLRDPADACARAGACSTALPAANSPVMAWNSVVLPVPLRPTSPTRAPSGMRTEAWSISRRPAMRSERSLMTSMRGCSGDLLREASGQAQRSGHGAHGSRFIFGARLFKAIRAWGMIRDLQDKRH